MPVSSDDQRREHRHARRRSVLRDRARRDVDVDVGLLEEVLRRGRATWRAPRTNDSAACADSFITSPSWPVSISLPLPGILRRLDEEDVAADRRPREARSPRPARRCAPRPRRRTSSGPRNSSMLAVRDDARARCAWPSATLTATARQTSSRSRARGYGRRPRACSCRSTSSDRVVGDRRAARP